MKNPATTSEHYTMSLVLFLNTSQNRNLQCGYGVDDNNLTAWANFLLWRPKRKRNVGF